MLLDEGVLLTGTRPPACAMWLLDTGGEARLLPFTCLQTCMIK